MTMDQFLRLLVMCPIKYRKHYEVLYSILLAYKNVFKSMLSRGGMAQLNLKLIYCNMEIFPLLWDILFYIAQI